MNPRNTRSTLTIIAGVALIALSLPAASAWAVEITSNNRDAPLVPETFELGEGPVSLAVANGDVRLTEDAEGGVAVLGGTLTLAEGVEVSGPVAVVGGALVRDGGARARGDVLELPGEWLASAVKAFYGVNGDVTPEPGSVYREAEKYTVEPDAVVNGDLVVAWGDVVVEGVVEGSILALGSSVTLTDSAEVRGGILQVTSEAAEPLQIDARAVVRGAKLRLPRPVHAGSAPPLASAKAAESEALTPTAEAPEGTAESESPASEPAANVSYRQRSLGPIMGGSATIVSGEEVEEVVVFGGRATIEEGARAGDVVIWGGEATIDGEVAGDLVIMGGRASLGPRAVVSGDAVVMGGEIKGAEGARIDGDGVVLGGRIDVPGVQATEGMVDPFGPGKVTVHRHPAIGWTHGALSRLVSGLVMFLLSFGLVLLVTGAWPERVESISSFARWNLGRCLGTGLLGVGVAALITLVFSLITCLIGALLAVPLMFAILWLAHIIGAAGIAALVGNVLLSKTKLSAATLVGEVAAGALAIGLVKWVGASLPFVGALVSIAMLGLWLVELGAVIETRWGVDAGGGGRPWPAGRHRNHRPSPATPSAWPPREDPFDDEWIRDAAGGGSEAAPPPTERQDDAPVAPDAADDPDAGEDGRE